MEKSKSHVEGLLDSDASKALRDVTAEFREILLATAEKRSSDGQLSGDDIYAAYKKLEFPTRESVMFADSQAIISQAFRENRILEWISYVMATVLFALGLVLIAMGALASDGSEVAFLTAGSILEVLILIPFRFAVNVRRHNIALRMLGIILNRVDNKAELSALLKETFLAVVLGRSDDKSTDGK